MESRLGPTPAFGKADLSNCEREQIHLAGSIQPHGALLVVRESDQVIVQASANAAEFLALDGDVLGARLQQLPGNLYDRISPHLNDPLQTIPIAVRCHIGDPPSAFDGLLHRPPQGGLVIELERAGPAIDLSTHVEQALPALLTSSSLAGLCDQVARVFRDLTRYDRVMVYRFDDEGHGEVYSEQRRADLEPYLGNRYPASDIPQIARRLYERTRVRVLVDVDSPQAPIQPRLSPVTGGELDMSLCFLRSMSPIHIQYLKNMGVSATLVASLVVGGKLWGLVACHHYQPHFVHFEVRAVCEVLAETIAIRIAALESFAQAQAELSVRRLEQRLIEAITRDGEWRTALFDSTQSLLQPLNATGAALLFEGQVLTTGDVPGTQELREIGKWLDARPRQPVFATASLGIDQPDFTDMIPVASGLVAAPVSSSPGEYLLWFRPERIRTVTWGGNPFKPMQIGADPSDLSPRRSFAQWHQLVEGTSDPWTPADLTAARLIGDTVADVVLQFRSLRTLIAQDQLAHVSRQVQRSDQPVIIVEDGGRILLTNESFQRMLHGVHPNLHHIEDLAEHFTEAPKIRQVLRDLLAYRRVWRGEVSLLASRGEPKPLLVRADPVFSSPNRVLGFVLMFTDITERKVAETARRRLQENLVGPRRFMTVRLDSKADLVYRNLLNSLVGNAQLAALEITDGVDVTRMPEMLDSVKASVTRTAEVLEHLVWHTSRTLNDQ